MYSFRGHSFRCRSIDRTLHRFLLLRRPPWCSCFGLLSSMFYFPATNLFRLLRLFKNERLVAGDTFVISTKQSEERVLSQTSFGKRCSENDIDYTLLQLSSGSYTLNSADIPFFTVFSNALLPQLQALQEPQSVETPPPLEIALVLYNQDDYLENVAVLNCLTALEALLTNDSNTELSYRLSVRVANLLGSDDADRVSLFREMKEFYDLRSKIVHGSASKLSTKLQNRLQLTDSLREIVRKVILSVMALAISSELTQSRLEELLDQLVFDEAKRRDVQAVSFQVSPHRDTLTICSVTYIARQNSKRPMLTRKLLVSSRSSTSASSARHLSCSPG